MAREVYELRVNYNSSIKRVNDLKECLNIDSLLSEIKELEEKVDKEGFWDDNRAAKKVLKQIAKDKENIEQITKLETWYKDINDLIDSNDEEMLELSKHFPDTVFCLHGEGEESGDLWYCYYKNGKSQYCPAQIVYEEYDEAKLQ